MSSNTAPRTRDLFAQVHQVLDTLNADVLGPDWTDIDLSWAVEELQRIENRVEAEKLRRLAAFDDRQAHIAFGARSGADWAAHNLNLTPGQSRKMIDTADRLQDLPETSKKLADGDLGVDNAAAAAR